MPANLLLLPNEWAGQNSWQNSHSGVLTPLHFKLSSHLGPVKKVNIKTRGITIAIPNVKKNNAYTGLAKIIYKIIILAFLYTPIHFRVKTIQFGIFLAFICEIKGQDLNYSRELIDMNVYFIFPLFLIWDFLFIEDIFRLFFRKSLNLLLIVFFHINHK